MPRKRIMAVVKGPEPRMSEMFFYSHFRNLAIRFIGNNKRGWVVKNDVPKNIEYIELPLKPAFLFDPVSAFLGTFHLHRGWLFLADLERWLLDVDVVAIYNCFYFYSAQCAKICQKLGKKLVTVVWETVPNHPSTYIPPYSFCVKSVLEATDLFILKSEAARAYINSLGIQNNRCLKIYEGIDLAQFQPASSSKSEKIRILFVGQLIKEKGVNELLKAFVKLSKEYQNLELWFCGRGNLAKKIVDLSQNYPIYYLGFLEYNDLPSIYRQCQIFCLPSQDWKYLGVLPGGNEWFSYSIMEAMVSGLPVVATNVGGIPEEVGRGNILVRQKDVNTLYSGLKKLIQNEELRKKIGISNRKRAENLFNIKRQAQKTEEAILEIL